MIEPMLRDDAFLPDVARFAGDSGDGFRLWWLGQSGFLVQWRGRHFLFDPYLSDSLTRKYEATAKPHVRMSRRVVAPEKLGLVDVVTSTHAHTDHLDADTLVPLAKAVAGSSRELTLIHPAAIHDLVLQRTPNVSLNRSAMNAGQTVTINGFEVQAVPAAHDKLEVDAAGNHLYLGYVVRFGGWSIYHSGDGVVFDGLVASVRATGPIDVAILPINGKVGNVGGRDAARLAKDIGARVVIPCHYDMFEFNTADPQAEFVPECERIGQRYRILQLGERFSSNEMD